MAVDNLRRRGAEMNLPRLKAAGIWFTHGDVRVLDDLLELPALDALVDARPSRPRWQDLVRAQTTLSRPICSAATTAWSLHDGTAPMFCLSPPAGCTRCPRSGRWRSRRQTPDSSWLRCSRSTAPPRLGSLSSSPFAALGRFRLDQAGRRATDRGVPRRVRVAGGHRPLRGNRGALADGEGRPGRVYVLGAQAYHFRRSTAINRVWRSWKAGP